MIFSTTTKQKKEVLRIAGKMREAKIDKSFVKDIIDIANIYEGTYNLMELWEGGDDKTLADLEEIIKEEKYYRDIEKRLKENKDKTKQFIFNKYKKEEEYV